MINIRKLEAELWESADLLRSGSKLTSNQYCMPVLGLIFLRYAYSRFKMAEAEILKNRPSRGGRVMPVEASDFAAKSALFLPKEAQYDYLLNLPDDIASAGLVNRDGQTMTSLGEVVNNAMALIEEQSGQLTGVLPKSYTDFSDELLSEFRERTLKTLTLSLQENAKYFTTRSYLMLTKQRSATGVAKNSGTGCFRRPSPQYHTRRNSKHCTCITRQGHTWHL